MQFPIHPHMLRHGCGYALANAGHDTRALQAWLGTADDVSMVIPRFVYEVAFPFVEKTEQANAYFHERPVCAPPRAGDNARDVVSFPLRTSHGEGRMTVTIGRRELLAALGGAAAWPLTARAQQGELVRRVGLLMGVADDREGQARVTALKQGLQELGWTDGNIQIETRFGGADAGRIRSHAAELVALGSDVIVANTTPVIRAVRQATSSIPIVMAGVNDPVEQGFVSSLAHPGGNITGFSFVDFQMVGKWLEMLKEAAPAFLAPYSCSTPTCPPNITSTCVRSRPCRGQSQLR
jgi:putative ABC transport system substrate-binding protein